MFYKEVKQPVYSIHNLSEHKLEIHKEYTLVECLEILGKKNKRYFIYRVSGAFNYIWGNKYLDYIWGLKYKSFMLYPFCNIVDKKEYIRPIPSKKGKRK